MRGEASPVFGGSISQVFSTRDRDVPHEGYRVPHHNTKDVEEQMTHLRGVVGYLGVRKMTLGPTVTGIKESPFLIRVCAGLLFT